MRLGNLLREGQYDLVHTFMLRMAPYISDYKGFPKIIELIDSMELNMKRRASLEKNPKKWIFNLESRKLSVYEKIMVKKFDCAIVVSQLDKKLIGQDNIVVNPLGVDTEIFHPMKSVKKYPYLIIFSGNMGYFPNEKAVLYFVNDIFPQVQEKIPKAKFQVAGGGASHIIKQLEKKNRAIKILGFVDSMSYYINRASVSVGPMTAGSGMQFKILEALACGVPVVATSLAQGDIELNEGDGLFIADDPAVFADRVVRIIEDKRLQNVIAKTGPQAIREKKYSWERSNLVVENIYSGLTNLKR
jgi:glycosyltransferase involved in cell wall biosynthesis